MSNTPKRITDLSPDERRALAARLLHKKVSEPRSFPVSFAQKRLWLLEQFEPGTPVYNIPTAVRLRGPLNVTVLEQSFNEIVRRHGALRTTFTAVDGTPIQVIAPPRPFEVPFIDLEDEPKGEQREEEAKRFARQEARQPFDLERGPLFRAKLLRLGEEDHVLLLTIHHIISDGWSMSVLWRELGALYEAFAEGKTSPLRELPIQYADYAVWQRQWLQGETLEKQLSYWRRQLTELPILELPTDHPRPAVQTHRGARQSLELPHSLSEALNDLSRQEGVTLFMVLLGAFQVLLSRYSGQEDIVVGTPIAGRNRAETEGLIGFFVNTLVIRTELSGDPTFKELLRRVREVALGAYDHQDLPFEKLVEELNPERELSRTPFFQVMFALQNVPPEAPKLKDLTLQGLSADRETAKFDLSFSLSEEPQGITGRLNYNADLFDEAAIERMLSHLQTLLEGIVEDPDQRLSELPLLTKAERDRLLFEWNDTATEYPDSCVHTLFEEQVERMPEAVAVVFEDEQLTYRQLNENANRIASALEQRGIGKGSYVPVLMDRSIEMVISLLSVMKSGAAFVPLDTRWPTERLRLILDDLNSEVVLLNKESLSRQEELGQPSLLVDAQATETSIPNLDIELDPSEPIYAIYTSGSTGKPKGAINVHRGITNRLLWMNDFFGRESAAVVLHTTHHVFDSAICQLLWPLINGGKAVVPSPMMEMSADYLAALIEKHGVTITDFVPSVFNVLVPQLVTGSDEVRHKLRSLRSLIIGGEEITPSTTYTFLEHFPGVRITNLYGPTEASIGCICHEVRGNENAKIPIGKPIANAHAIILDREMNLVPMGVVGELYITGTCLGLGYLNDEEKTRAAFVDNPFGEIDHDKLYRTGDLARYLSEGEIEFLGRIDHQVKIRGFRIEPGEIEAALRRHPTLHQAVVIAREDLPGDKDLVAYVVPNQDATTTPSVGDLRSFLREKLPAYMVPSAIVVLEALPLTPNGKIDRRALPAPDPSSFRAENAYAAPRTPLEERLVEIWEEVLGLGRVGVRDNFFELGGHSLLATRVVSRVRAVFGVELPLLSLFEAPTIAGLAERIGIARRGAQSLPAPPLVAASRDAQLPLSFSQQRLWLLDQLELDGTSYNIWNAVRLDGGLDVEALRRSLNEIVRRHEALRTTITAVGGEPVQVIAPSTDIKLPIEDLTTLPEAQREAEARQLFQEEARCPFELERGPLVRAKLLRLDQEEHLLLLTMHHIVSDGWSMSVFWRELRVLYEAFSRGEPSPLAELPIQYADYALWQRQWLQGEVLDKQLTYWKWQLAELPTLELPTDHPRPPIQTHHGARQSLMLPPSFSEGLRELARKEGATLFMVLLAAFQVLLSRYAGQQDVAVGTPIAGRNRAETEGLIGFFVNTLVMRTDLSGDPSFGEVLSRVREVALGAYDHQDLPFEKLVEELNPERDLSRTPLFQVFLNVLNTHDTTIELSGLTVEPLSPTEPTDQHAESKFDLTLYVSERPESLHLKLVYNADLFEHDTIEQMLSHFRALLEGITADPQQRLSSLSLLSETERHHIPARAKNECKDLRPAIPFTQWSQEDIEQSIPRRFEEQVRKHPHKIAIKSHDHEWTYAELNTAANRVARTILTRGGGGTEEPERIALLFEHGAPMIAGLLGALKAGKTYVPLDASYPEERPAYMLDDAQVGAVLTDEANLALATTLTEGELQLINVDELDLMDNSDSSLGAADVEDVDLAVSPESVAYILYTSGSTGQPKGVVQNHRNALHFIRAYTNNLRIGADDRLTLLSSYTHDAALMDIFGALLNGATLYPIDLKEEGFDALAERLVERGVTIYHSTPTVYRHFVDTLNGSSEAEEKFPELRLVVLGGEAVNHKDVEIYKAHFSEGCLFVNLLGASEASVSLLHFVDRRTKIARHAVPAGYAVEDTEILLLDQAGRVAEVYGEIAIRSPCVALGYWRKPELNQQVFLPDPERGNWRIYRTGDVGRLLPDGAIEWRGRKDHQVKLRGYRIELGEVETVLGGYPGVRESAVVLREEEPGEPRLVAYVVPDEQGQAPSPRELRSYLKERLLEYMVPSAFVVLEALPLTPNGKVDRRALPAPEVDRPELEEAFVAPRTPAEEALAGIWEEVLGLERVGIHDDFFDLGGHSLLAMQVVARLYRHFGVELPLRTLFEHPTVAGLAERIRVMQQSRFASSTVALGSDDLEELRF